MECLLYSEPTESSVEPQEEETLPWDVPEPLVKILHLLTKAQRELMIALCVSEGERVNHLFEHWNESFSPSFKKILVEQLETIDKAYPSGGLVGYLENARDLLEKKTNVVNPLEGWKPIAPLGEAFDLDTEDYTEVEKLGMRELDAVGFVVVAESKTKLGLPVEMATGTTYLQLYIESILAIETNCGKTLPLCIVTSSDAFDCVKSLLDKNNRFGMTDEQITIINQSAGVPALVTSEAKLVLDPNDEFKIVIKPHGNGDVHALLHEHGVAKEWKQGGTEWIVFMQDNNGLAFHTLPLLLGSSVKNSFIVNTLAFPRKKNEESDSIVMLEHFETKETRTINLEYNELETLLRCSDCTDGDEKTGFSTFPGNTNQFVCRLQPYVDNMERTKGAIPESVKVEVGASHLECRMQDFVFIFQGREAKKVGYTCVSARLCYSPVANTDAEGAALQAKGLKPACATSAEADQYSVHRKIMRSIGCQIEKADPQTNGGVSVVSGSQIVLKPSVVCFPGDYPRVFPYPEKVKISARSSLVVTGVNVTIDSLDLDGALVIHGVADGGEVKDLMIRNKGWSKHTDEKSEDGYRLEKSDTAHVLLGLGQGEHCTIL